MCGRRREIKGARPAAAAAPSSSRFPRGTLYATQLPGWPLTPRLREYAKRRDWSIVVEIRDIASGTSVRPRREELIQSARRRELDVILVWRLDRWGRSLLDLIGSLQELNELGVGFVSLSESLDLTTASGRALAGMLAVFAEFERDILRDRVKAGIAQARRDGKPHGRPPTVQQSADQIRALHKDGVSKSVRSPGA